MLKQDLIAAIVGYGPIDLTQGNLFTNRGLCEFTGDQHNPDYAFKKRVLEKMSVAELEALILHVRR